MILPINSPDAITEKLTELQDDINTARAKGVPVGRLTDGYCSFNQLYQERTKLYIVICKYIAENTLKDVWVSKLMADKTPVQEGYFLMGIFKQPAKAIVFYIPLDLWDQCQKFSRQLQYAPAFTPCLQDEFFGKLLQL